MVEKPKKYKENCKFRENNLCWLTVDQCRPQDNSLKTEDFCELYELSWDKDSLKARMDCLQSELKTLTKTKGKKSAEREKLLWDKGVGLAIVSKAYLLAGGKGLQAKSRSVLYDRVVLPKLRRLHKQ